MTSRYDDEQVHFLRSQIKVFKDNSIAVHLFMKDGSWLRGTIGVINDDFFMLTEEVMGELPVFFRQINSIQKRKIRDDKPR